MKQFASGHAMQSAWVVDDLDAAVDAWLKVGIGPFFFVEYTPELFENSTYRGSPSPISICLLYTSPSPRDLSTSRMPSSA